MQARINRIRLEFKVSSFIFFVTPIVVLIESDWNLKVDTPVFSEDGIKRINRIRLEFKDSIGERVTR